MIYQLVTFWLVDIAIENGPFIDYLFHLLNPIKHGDFSIAT